MLPAPAVVQVRRKQGTWTAYKVHRWRYVVYAEVCGVRIFRGSYRTRFFAALRCRRGH